MKKQDLHKAVENIDANKAIKKEAHDYINTLEKADLDAITADAKDASEALIDEIVAKTEKAEGKKPSKPRKISIDKILTGKEPAPIIDPEGKDVIVGLPDTCKTPLRIRQKADSKGSVTVATNKQESHKLPSPPGFTDFYNNGPGNWSFVDKGI